MAAMLTRTFFLLLAAMLAFPLSVQSWYPRLAEDSYIAPLDAPQIVGKNRPYYLGPDEDLIRLAWRGGLGYKALLHANPGVDPWLPKPGTEITLPYSMILPAGLTPGITINLAELRLYFIWEENRQLRVRAYPISVGAEGLDTPEGLFSVKNRVQNPSWTAPASVREERPDGPLTIPPGPDNPLGDYWIGLSIPGYGIHGTNKPLGVGRRVSHGCIRLYPDDVKDLFPRVKVGTPVRIIYQPIKMAITDGVLLAEIHDDYLGRVEDPLNETLRLRHSLDWNGPIDWQTLEKALEETRGIPVPISSPTESFDRLILDAKATY